MEKAKCRQSIDSLKIKTHEWIKIKFRTVN